MLKRTNKIIKSSLLYHYQTRHFSNQLPNDYSRGTDRCINKQFTQSILKPLNESSQEKQEKQQYYYSFGFRLFAKLCFIYYTIYSYQRGSDLKEDDNISFPDMLEKNNYYYLKTRFTTQDYDLFCKKTVFILQDSESMYFIFLSFLDKFGQIKLVESGIYNYCIDYLLKHNHHQLQQQQNGDSILLTETRLDPTWITLSRFKEIQNQNPKEFEKEACLICKKLILKTVEYNRKYGLSDIKLPQQLEYLKHSIGNGNASNKIINSKEFIKKESIKNIKVVSFGFCTTFAYMLIRCNKTLFPSFSGSRISNIVLSSLTTGFFLFTALDNRRYYDQDVKKFMVKYVEPIVPNYKNYKQLLIRNSWFNFSMASVLPLILLQYRLYFITPYLISLYLLDELKIKKFKIKI